MKVSVVIPAYNEGQYLPHTLESLSRQSVMPNEVIVVDNNCTDNTAEICTTFGARVIREQKQGMIPARNTGFNNAKSSIIARCDADTILPRNWIERIHHNFEFYDIDALTGPIIYYDMPFSTSIPARVYLNMMRVLCNGETLIGSNMILRKSIWQKIKNDVTMDDSKVHEDIDLAFHISAAGGVIRKDKSLIVLTSGRRIRSKPWSFFIEYPLRLYKTWRHHQ